MSAPRTKRQFAGAASDPSQRQITSFFSSTAAGATPPSSQETTQQPLLPANVQTNLLSVGMRVRKSVPEGYKTGSPYSGFKLWSDADPSPAPAAPRRKQLPLTTAQRELLPFCGIHSIGGMSHQPAYEDEAPSYAGSVFLENTDIDDVPGLDDIPGLTSSQETVDSEPPSVAGGQPGRKRIYDDAEDDDDAASAPRRWVDNSSWTEGNVSPRSLAPAGWGNARAIATPRNLARRKASATPRVGVVRSYEQENIAMGDFDEADFLVDEGMDLTGA